MGSSRKAKARRKTTHTKVKVGLRKKRYRVPLPVVLPGTEESTPWDKETTLRRNYKALGLACDPNGEHGRLNSVKRVAVARQEAEEALEAEPTLGEQAQTDEEGLRVALGQHLPRGHRPPRQLTATQMRVVGTLVEAHGDDIAAMARDIKRNSMQHTAGSLRVLVAAFHAHRSGDRHEFRAPKKRL